MGVAVVADPGSLLVLAAHSTPQIHPELGPAPSMFLSVHAPLCPAKPPYDQGQCMVLVSSDLLDQVRSGGVGGQLQFCQSRSGDGRDRAAHGGAPHWVTMECVTTWRPNAQNQKSST
jgi:hypothetical protein